MNLKDGFDNNDIYLFLNENSLLGLLIWVWYRWKFGFRIIDINIRNRVLRKELWMKEFFCLF